jgi:hypothetical protein
MKPSLRLAIGLLAFSVGTAAATPLPDPPFSSGGFVPPTSLDLRIEGYVGRSLLKYLTNSRKCDYKAVLELQLAYEPANATKIAELQTKWQLCRQKVSDRYVRERDAIIIKGAGTPECLNEAAEIDEIRDLVDDELDATKPVVFCDGDAANPDPVTLLNIPDFRAEANGEADVAKVLLKLNAYSYKCFLLAAKYAFKFGGTIPPEVMTKIDLCFQKAQDRSDDAMMTLDQRQKLPGCISLAAAQAAGSAAIAFQGTLTDDIYCSE